MKITQIRNATIIVEFDNICLLVDPMLANKGALPALKLLDGRRERNPLVELPEITDAMLSKVTHCLITHCQKGHFDHLDNAGKKFLRERQIPVICTPHDATFLRKRGLNVQVLDSHHAQGVPFFNGLIQSVACRHGEGLIGMLMEHGVGYFIQIPNQASLYLSGDTILTKEVCDFVEENQPDVSVIPAGGAHFHLGGEIIMGMEEVITFTRLSKGIVIANHLEALSHCPVKRCDLNIHFGEEGTQSRLKIPLGGESIIIQI
jgi:L-ascorbate metabolism protein UlaG (beta-lactamase superfamily)